MKQLLTGLLLAMPLVAISQPSDPLVAESRQRIKAFAQTLKGELSTSMKTSGPVAALSVCNIAAPRTAQEQSSDEWTIRRTSLKLRNANNQPDIWEQKVLEYFESEKQKGVNIKKLEYHETVQQKGASTFRYMKAIPTWALCLNCHGATVAEGVEEKLKTLYPDDQARGYQVGDIRGAFSLSKPML